jgi:hypothetical protein
LKGAGFEARSAALHSCHPTLGGAGFEARSAALQSFHATPPHKKDNNIPMLIYIHVLYLAVGEYNTPVNTQSENISQIS